MITILDILKTHRTIYFKWVNFRTCKISQEKYKTVNRNEISSHKKDGDVAAIHAFLGVKSPDFFCVSSYSEMLSGSHWTGQTSHAGSIRSVGQELANSRLCRHLMTPVQFRCVSPQNLLATTFSSPLRLSSSCCMSSDNHACLPLTTSCPSPLQQGQHAASLPCTPSSHPTAEGPRLCRLPSLALTLPAVTTRCTCCTSLCRADTHSVSLTSLPGFSKAESGLSVWWVSRTWQRYVVMDSLLDGMFLSQWGQVALGMGRVSSRQRSPGAM